MDNIIGYKGTTEERFNLWNGMVFFKRGWRELISDPATKSIAEQDLKRYKRMVKSYVK